MCVVCVAPGKCFSFSAGHRRGKTNTQVENDDRVTTIRRVTSIRHVVCIVIVLTVVVVFFRCRCVPTVPRISTTVSPAENS